jgi:GAF domain/PilZ domain/Sel1 repeat
MEHLRPAVKNTGAITPERRRRPRQKIHTPAYASFNVNSDSPGLDLSEILDISENGIAIQAVPPLEPKQNVRLCIDLSETKTYIRTTGTVVWSDASGRAGISLSDLPDAARDQLHIWMLQNAVAACLSPLPEPPQISEVIARRVPATQWHPGAGRSLRNVEVVPLERTSPRATDYTALLTALAAVQKEVASFGTNLDAALQLIAQRARAFTLSTGAAIALSPAHGKPHASDWDFQATDSDDTYMLCRASSGSGVPPIGVQLQVSSGFSGECVHTGQLLRCDDSENDPHVDRENCRVQGIRSMVAAPIRLGSEVIGIIEVFSPVPNAFNESDTRVLESLAEAVVAALHRCKVTAIPATAVQNGSALPADAELSEAEPSCPAGAAEPMQRLQGIPVHAAHLIVLLTVAALIATVLGFLLAPWVDGRLRQASAHQHAKPQLRPAAAKSAVVKTVADASTIDELRNLAGGGDAMAQFALGAHYMIGEDVKQDYAEAIRWFTKAAEQGHVGAQSALGAYYWVGRGVTKNLQRAYFWSILARAQGDETSKYRVAVISSGMRPSEILAAELEVDNWLRNHRVAANSSPSR